MVDHDDDKAFRRRVAWSFLYSGIGNGLSRIVSVAALLIALKAVTEDEFGTASLVLAIITILRSVTELSLGVALVQIKTLRESDLHSLFWFSLLVSLVFYALLALVGAPLLAWFYDDPQLASLVRVHSVTIVVFSFFFVSRTLMERDLQFGRMTIIDNVALMAASGLMIALAVRGHGAWAFVWTDVAFRCAQGIMSQIARPYLPRFRFRPREVWSMITFGAYASGSRLFYNFYINSDYLVVGKIFGSQELGIYTFAYRVISDPVKALAGIVNQVAYPAFARLQDQHERLTQYFFTIARLSLTLIGLFLIAVVVYIDQVLIGFGFEKYLPSVPLVRIFALVGLLQAIAPLVPQLLNAVGRPRQNFLYAATCSVVLPLGFLAGAQFSLTGVAVAWVVGYPLVVLLLFWFGARALELPMTRMLPRTFSGLIVLAPLAASVFGLRLVLVNVLAYEPRVVAIVGMGLTLLLGGLAAYARERKDLQVVRGRGRDGDVTP